MATLTDVKVTATFEECGHSEVIMAGTQVDDLCSKCLTKHMDKFDDFFLGIERHSLFVVRTEARIHAGMGKRGHSLKRAKGFNHQSAH